MRRALEHIRDAAGLDQPSRIHHRYPVNELRHHAEVVRDQDHRHLELLLQRAEQVEDLRLDGHIQRGCRLVGQQQRRRACQRDRDHHALAHTAGELMRIFVETLRW